MNVAALFCCPSSPYRELGADVWDVERDARRFPLDRPIVAHPPCRAWGRLRAQAKPRDDERDLAIWAVWAARLCGGVVEHPACSGLWPFFGLRPGVRDEFGGLLVVVDQAAYGHRSVKRTALYLVRCELRPRLAWGVRRTDGRSVALLGRAERERTPLELARELVHAAAGAAA